MSGKTEIVYEPDTDIDIEEFKLEPTDTDHHSKPTEYFCDQCDYKAVNSQVLKLHKECHSNILSCDQCDFVTQHKTKLYRHKGLKHDKFKIKWDGAGKYPCDLCDYSATQLSRLTRHKAAKHEGIRHEG